MPFRVELDITSSGGLARCIWARTISAIRPPVNVQSVPRFLAASPHANAKYSNQGNTNPTSAVLDYVASPCKA